MAANPTHTKLAATATRLISENGAPMQLWREVTTGPDYDPIVTTETADITAVRTRFSAFEVGDGSRIKSTDLKLLIDSSVDPRDNYQKIIDGSNELQIIDTLEVIPGEVSIIYKVQARL
jgi:hypothetical protein